MSRGRATYSVDAKALKAFNETTKKKAINRSGLIELFMREWTEKNKAPK